VGRVRACLNHRAHASWTPIPPPSHYLSFVAVSIAYAYQESRVGFQAGAARAPDPAQEAASAEH
jgi:hypothetical protein